MSSVYKLICFYFIFQTYLLVVQAKDNDDRVINKPSGSPNYTKLNVGNISTYIYNNGSADTDPSGNSGFVFPKSAFKTAIFESGFLWGGKVSGEISVGGSTYRSGLQPGKILSLGIPEDPNLAKNRIYRVRPDYKTGDLQNEETDEYSDYWTVFNQYEKDWNEWPANDGAPFDDINANGIYEPLIDTPGIKGASQTIWYVANDLHSASTFNLYGSAPIGIELQVTVWAYSNKGSFSDLIFKKYKLINKSNSVIDSMYVSIWSDPDVGTATDDFVGCDTLLNLGFTYNATNNDGIYGNYPPAIGFGLLQGPIINGSVTDTATFDGRRIIGKKNLSMTAFYYFTRGDATVRDPFLGVYEGSLQFYNFLQGKVGLTGEYFLSPLGVRTKYALSGDPSTGNGWIDGQLISADDRRMGLSFGPFQMAPSDTQEVIFAQVAEIGSQSVNANVSNIIPLKRKQNNIQGFIKNGLAIDLKGDHFAPINRIINLRSYILLVNPLQSVPSYSWEIFEKPISSTAQVTTINSDEATFSADIEGKYKIGLTVNTSLGYSATGYIEITATSLQPPEAKFNFEKSEITWGDSVIVDGTESFDPQSQNIDYYWSGDGIINEFNNGDKIEFFPYRAGAIPLNLQVSNDYFSSEVFSNSITVHPKIKNINTEYSFADPDNIWAVYFHGDTLLGMNSEQSKIKVYDIKPTGITHRRSIDIPGVNPYSLQKIVGIKNNKLFVLTYSETGSGFFGVGALSVYSIGSDWELTLTLQNYKPSDYYGNDIFSIEFIDDTYALVRDQYGVYVIDFFSNPSAPIIIKQYTHHQFSGINVRRHRMTNNYIYLGSIDHSTGNNFIEVVDKNTLSFVGNINLKNYIYDFLIKDNYLIVSYQSNDTLDVFDVLNLSIPSKINSFVFRVPIHWLASIWSNSLQDVNDDVFAIINQGITFFRYSDILNPTPKASWYDGKGKYITNSNGNYYLFPTDMRDPATNQESGINRVTLDIAVSVEDNNQNKLDYFISQNYPNPFNPVTKIKYSIPQRCFVTLKIYDVLGNEVTRLINEDKQAGNYEVEFNGLGLSSGVYFYIIQAGEYRETKKMVLLR